MELPADLCAADVVGETVGAWHMGFPQGGATWLRARHLAVGGTAIASLLGDSRYRSPEETIAEMVEPRRLEITLPMARGLAGEGVVRRWVEETYGTPIEEIGMAVSKAMPWMRASPDGIYRLPGGGIGLLEIKVASSIYRIKSLRAVAGRLATGPVDAGWIPREHYHQINYAAGVLGAEEILYCVLAWDACILTARMAPDPALFWEKHVPAAAAAYNRALQLKNGTQ